MDNWEYRTTYAGLPVFRFDQERLGAEADRLPELPPAGEAAWCVAAMFGDWSFGDVWERFRESVDTTQVKALLLGYWESGDYPVPLLAEAAASFPALRSLFLGEIVDEEAQISCIDQGDVSPILRAFPDLERLDVRGTQNLVLEPVKSDALRVLRLESGGLPTQIVRAVSASDLPNLEHLDLRLGEENYGRDATVDDLAPFLSGERMPALRHLGLEDAEIQDEIAEAVAGAPVVARLESLSLAMGILTDRGAEALLSGQPLTHLRRLDLHHHFLSDTMMARVQAELPGVEIDLSEQEQPDDGEWFFVAVGE